MKVNRIEEKEIVDFNSLKEFYDYINKTPFNNVFKNKEHSSSSTSRTSWYGTDSFEEATDLFIHGWKDMSNKLEQRIKAESKMESSFGYKNVLDVQGYQPVVPLYLQGVPTNMMRRKMVPIKSKIITVNKSVNYSGLWNVSDMEDESIKAFKIIKKLEAQGYRCNLNIVLGTTSDISFYVRIRVKSASEKLNISKLAFPMVHPSMLRRLLFRFIEVHPTVTKEFIFGYGSPISASSMREVFGDYTIPEKIYKDVDKIKSLDDLKNI